ncbi:hypothetical protein [Brevundimonas denitrificans]|uniref:hypothetical protein n=1 Tax=Brevundimonas denitrificans TaxID=1443434 RepID=UPI00223AEEEA|nr:hypothetical protein [Brevundimonas denitrificans]
MAELVLDDMFAGQQAELRAVEAGAQQFIDGALKVRFRPEHADGLADSDFLGHAPHPE